METLIKRVQEINRELIPPYYLVLEEEDVVKERKTPVTSVSREMPKYDLKYFDLVAINILLANHNDVIYQIPAEVAELACNMFYMANTRCGIYKPIQAEAVYEALAFGRMPRSMLVYQFLNKTLLDKSQMADVWFAYILQLWGLSVISPSNNHPYRSRALVGYINRCLLTENRNEHEHDLRCDTLGIMGFLRGYISLCTKDKRYQNQDYARYMVDSIRMLVVIYLALLIRRGCIWPEMSRLASIVLHQKSLLHEDIVRTHYKMHKQTGAVNQ